MTDNTDIEAFMRALEMTELPDEAMIAEALEQLAAFDNEEETTITMVCDRCGHVEEVPDWIIGEFAEIDEMSGLDPNDVGLQCPECDRGVMHIKR